jgi:pSer/pThr/pTyr-binding forkhead associated (FHA) protein
MTRPAITLTVLKGWFEGECYVFDRPTQCTVGRGNDCTIHFPLSAAYLDISRHHCVFEIDPPALRVRDLGSLNGTYVNGEKIGQRSRGWNPEELDPNAMPAHDLHPGDEIQVGDTIFRVGMVLSSDLHDSSPDSLVPARAAE